MVVVGEMNRYTRVIILAGLVSFSVSCGDTDGSGIWPFGGGDDSPGREVELYAEMTVDREIQGVVEPEGVAYKNKFTEGDHERDRPWRIAPAEDQMRPIAGLAPELPPPLPEYMMYAEEDRSPSPDLRDDWREAGYILRAGIFDARGRLQNGKSDGRGSTFRVDSVQLKECRTARATGLFVFPQKDDMCVAFGDNRCEVREIDVAYDPEEPHREIFETNHFRVRIDAECSSDQSVRLTFRFGLEPTGVSTSNPTETARFREVDRLYLECRSGESSRRQIYRKLGRSGWPNAIRPGPVPTGRGEETGGVRALALRFDPDTGDAHMPTCPDGELLVWGAIEPESYPVPSGLGRALFSEKEPEPVDE